MDTSNPASSPALSASMTPLPSSLPPSTTSSLAPSFPTALPLSFPSIPWPSISLPSLSLPSLSLPSLSLPLSLSSPSSSSLAPSAVSATTNSTDDSGNAINVPFLVGCIVGSIGGLSLSVGGLLFFLYRRQRRKDLKEKEESQQRLDLIASDTETAEGKTVGQAVLFAQNSRLTDLRDRETYTDAGRLPPGRAVSQSPSDVFRLFRNGTPEV